MPMVDIVRPLGRTLAAVGTLARRTGNGLLYFAGALGVVSPIAGWAYVYAVTGMNALANPDFWQAPFRNLVGLAVAGLLFLPIEIFGALLRFSGTREHALFVLSTVLGSILWVMGMVRLRRVIRRQRPPVDQP